MTTASSYAVGIASTAQEMEVALDNRTLNDFLRSVEKRGFRMAQVAVGNREDALDILQDTMSKLAQLYGDRTWDDWRPLFYRILRSRINDFHRRRAVQNRYRTWIERLKPASIEPQDQAADPYEYVSAAEHVNPDAELESDQRIARLEEALQELPRRQREAFMLRCWEGLSTAETASAMQCSEGSVKTHYFRALQALRGKLGEYWR
ncbi:RNA polymerase sigma factor [Porticoccus sp. W117]|uniref:RNA polymerase sigma factor n=1 Tax=Porticoccus sp. W117 TaxID=3054777 RepID=UPI0025965DC9|nr:RNA polymerase sigma factor [Porticoccus sp. W117]MDM3871959.1 RNA polymerase sigma factor [Porticoccus sp. W117]